MPLFGLTPLPDAQGAPAWDGSTHRGPCRVMAPDARRARLYAANRFADPDAARTESGMLPPSPWMLTTLVAVEPTAGQDGSRVPEGTIMVPDDPDDPRGTLRILRRGFD